MVLKVIKDNDEYILRIINNKICISKNAMSAKCCEVDEFSDELFKLMSHIYERI